MDREAAAHGRGDAVEQAACPDHGAICRRRLKGPVVELGPGTGAITNALIEHGVDQKRLVLVEYNPGFCALLRDRYPQAKVGRGTAYNLRDSRWGGRRAPQSRGGSGLPLAPKPQ